MAVREEASLGPVQLGREPQLGRLGQVVLELLPADHQAHHIPHVVLGTQPLVVLVEEVEHQVQPGEEIVHQVPLAAVAPVHRGVGDVSEIIFLHGPSSFPSVCSSLRGRSPGAPGWRSPG